MGYGNEEVFLTPDQRLDLIHSYLGRTVDVIIDRPVGYVHTTKGITLHYPINYGYLPGVMGGDGDEQDVYVLGIREPLERFRGRIIAAVRRRDDNEDKLVAAPEGVTFTREQIVEAVYFTERYFDSFVYTGRKRFLVSVDDGTIWDNKMVALLEKYDLKGTFNLNSGLEDFVWELEGRPVLRQRLEATVEQYRGHEVASHSLTHPWLNSLTPPRLKREVGEDCTRLKDLFGLETMGFGVPFTACGEREIRLLRPLVRYIRLSEFASSFDLPEDPWHIPIHSLFFDEDLWEKLRAFRDHPAPVSLFVLAGHSYEPEFTDKWDALEAVFRYVRDQEFENTTTMAFVEEFY